MNSGFELQGGSCAEITDSSLIGNQYGIRAPTDMLVVGLAESRSSVHVWYVRLYGKYAYIQLDWDPPIGAGQVAVPIIAAYSYAGFTVEEVVDYNLL